MRTTKAARRQGLGARWGWTTAWGVAVAAIGLAGCGGGDGPPPESAATADVPSGPTVARGNRRVQGTVGPDGGTLTLEGGAELVIPAGALSEPTEITMTAVDPSEAIQMHRNQEGVGPSLLIVPAMRSAAGPFELSVPFLTLPSGYSRDDLALATEEIQEVQRAMGMGGTQTRWVMNPAAIEGDEVVGTLQELSGHRVQFVVAR